MCVVPTEISKVQQTGRIPHRDAKYVDIYREKQIRVVVKVLVPVKEHPKVRVCGCIVCVCAHYFPGHKWHETIRQDFHPTSDDEKLSARESRCCIQ